MSVLLSLGGLLPSSDFSTPLNKKTMRARLVTSGTMKAYIVALVSTLLVLHQTQVQSHATGDNERIARIEERIVGGKEVIARIPHQVAIQVTRWRQGNPLDVEELLCGGSLISETFVLTGAQCLDKVTRPTSQVSVTAGGIFLSENIKDGETVAAKSISVYPQWNRASLENDIGLVETPPFSIVPGILEPIRLPSKRQQTWSFWMWSATTSGWGKVRTEMGDTTVLHSVDSRILKNAFCKFKYSSEIIKDTNICTSGSDLKGLCTGDEGGPLFVKERDGKYTLLGISSFKGLRGHICETSMPSVFTRVAYEPYLSWINEKTKIVLRQ